MMDTIMQFWFEGLTDGDTIRAGQPPARKWFNADAALDREIRERFEPHLQLARAGDYAAWEDDAHGRLALILLFDQFTRNIYRGTAKMFADDRTAQRLCLRTIEDGRDRELMLIERVFLYMPLMHAEDPRLQDRSVAAFRQLVEETRTRCPHNTCYFEGSNLKYALQHRDDIERFGRFPTRNRILGRMSTPAEEERLKSQKGFSY